MTKKRGTSARSGNNSRAQAAQARRVHELQDKQREATPATADAAKEAAEEKPGYERLLARLREDNEKRANAEEVCPCRTRSMG
jgi:hypothetical protein